LSVFGEFPIVKLAPSLAIRFTASLVVKSLP
jgi:hypothetical protein